MNDGKNTTTDSYDGSTAKTFNVASANHTHSKFNIVDFPDSIKNPTSITISLNDGKNTTTDSYDGSKEKTFNAASAKHVHVKSEITDFPSSIKNPTAITISLNDGKTTVSDSYDGSSAKKFDVAKGKHVHVKSEITDFPASIKNPTSLSIQLNGGAATVYDGSSAKSINITPAGIGASANTHLHDDRYYTESEIDTKLSNINTTLTSHNHTELAGVASAQAVPGKSKDGFMTYHYNVNNGLTNNMPSSNNANAILTISRHAGDYTTQLGFSSDDNIYYRNGVGTTSWKRILDSSNYNNYAPSKTGSGASGTWGINISGKANTAGIADSANAVTWGNVSGKPSTFTPSSHTHTKSQITDFPSSIKNPTSLSIQLNGGTATTYDGSAAKSINITPAGIGAAASGHTHNYAGSSSVGGSANSAVKLDTTTAGSATQPVYFSGGKPAACTYTLGKSVPSNAVFTDTNTWRGIQNNLTSDSTSDSLSAAQGKALKKLIDGKAAASHTHTKSQITDFPSSMPASDVYSWAKASTKPSYSWSEISSKPSTFTPSSHTHNFVVGSYTGNGGQQKPNYFGTDKVGFLMMNTTVNGNSQYKDWIIMDCYSGSDVGGGVAIGVNRQSLGAYIMRSDATRTAWAESAELLHTKNYTSYTVTKTGGGASGTWGINITGKASTAGTADSANAVAWGNVSGKPSTFTPSSHNHDTAYLKLSGGTMTGTLSFKNTGLQIISNLPEDFSGTPRGDRQVLWYSKEFEDDSYKYEDYCTHYINLGTPNSGSGNGKFGANVTLRFYSNSSPYYTNIACNSLRSNAIITLPTNSGTLQVSSSDARLKTNINDTEVNDAISFINKIHLHSFDWKTDDTHQSIGFVADELEELDERLSVGGNSDKVDKNGLPIDPKCVNTFYLQGYEVKAIQELSSKVDALEKENDKLKDIVNQLLEKVTTLDNK